MNVWNFSKQGTGSSFTDSQDRDQELPLFLQLRRSVDVRIDITLNGLDLRVQEIDP